MEIKKLTKTKFLLFIILITNLLTLSKTQILPVPQQITQLINGVVTEINLAEKLGLNNCINEIKSISDKINLIPMDIQNENYISAFTKISEIFTDIIQVINKCPEMKIKIQDKITFFNNAYHNPGNFLHEGISNNISFSGLKNIYYLLDELNEKDLTNAGITLGKVLENFSSFKLNEGNSCMKIFKDLKNYLDIIVKNIFNDFEFVKNTLRDIIRKLNEIPAWCL
jgi:hypothetical protein